jgi:predicted nucleotidyltransferase
MQVIFEAIVGSRLYGTSTSSSDMDTKGLFGRPYKDIVPVEDHYFGLRNLPKDTVINKSNGLEGSQKVESVFYSIRKFLELCMKGNPTLIEVAFVPDNLLLHRTPISDEIMSYVRANFMTKQTLKSYVGYFLDQKRGNSNTPKKASHVYRIGMQAVQFAQTGIINPVLSGKELEMALDIRHNNVDKEELDRLIAYVDVKLQQAEKNNHLLAEPDEQSANEFLVYIHKKFYEEAYVDVEKVL